MTYRAQGGYVLVAVVATLFLLAAITLSLSRETSLASNSRDAALDAREALFVAEAGYQHALWHAHNNACTGDVTLPSTAFGNHSYQASVATPGGGGAPTVYTINPSDDTQIEKANPTQTYGTGPLTNTFANFFQTDVTRGLYRFDLDAAGIPPTAFIASAVLKLYVVDAEASNTVHEITGPWDETSATWDNINAAHSLTALATIPSVAAESYIDVNVTALVQAWLNGTIDNYGIMLKTQSVLSQLSQFTTKEYPDTNKRPYLEVTVGSSGLAATSPATVTATSTLANGVTRTITRQNVPIYNSAAATTVVLQPGSEGKDSFIEGDSGHHDHNKATNNDIRTDSETDKEYRGLLEFNLHAVPYGAKVLSATLELDLNSSSGADSPVNIHRLTQPWTEDGVTWLSRDGSSTWTTPGGDYDPTVSSTFLAAAPGTVSADVTDLVRGWVSGQTDNYGMLLRSPTASGNNEKRYTSSDDDTDPTLHPKLTISYACECNSICAAPLSSGSVLFVVDDAGDLDAADTERLSLLEGWGYSVDLISDGDNQAAFDAAVAGVSVAYVSDSVSPFSLWDKLSDVTIGVVYENGDLNNTFGIATSSAQTVGERITVTDNTHFITGTFPTGQIPIYAKKMSGTTVGGSLSGDLSDLGSWSGTGGLALLEGGASKAGGGTTPGRRVMLPLGAHGRMNLKYLNNNGRLLVQRAIDWGMGTDPITASQPLAHWKLDDTSGSTALDSIGSHDGDVSGANWTSSGKMDGALQFDGSNDVVEVPHDDSLSLGPEFTITAWVRNDSPSIAGSYRIISKETDGDNDSYWVSFQGNTLWAGIGGDFFFASPFLQPGTWYHVAVSFDDANNEVKIYVDGLKDQTYETKASLTPNDDPLLIGANWEKSKFWDGLLDDVRIYNRVLSDSEVTDLAYAPAYCDAEYAPDTQLGTFDADDSGDFYGRGITFYPEGRTLGGFAAPAGGAWVAVGDVGQLFLLDMAGNLVDDSFDTELPEFHGVTYIPAGQHAGKLVAVSEGTLHLIDPSITPASSSYTNHDLSSLTKSTRGISYIDGGTYDKHVAVVDTTNMEIYILDEDWSEVQTVNLGALTGTADDVAHVRGTDQFLVVNGSNAQVVMIDATETVTLSYETKPFGYGSPAAVAVHPTTCQHVVSDSDEDEYSYLTAFGGGGGGGYVEMHSGWFADDDDTWETYDLSAEGVPPNSVAEIAILNENTSAERWGGVRAVGSGLDRRLRLHEAESGGEDVVVMHVMTDSNGAIEHYSDDEDDVFFVVMGYWTSGTFVERFDNFSAGGSGSWRDRDLDSYGVSANQVAEIVLANTRTDREREAGVRADGSSLNRRLDLHEAESGGVDTATLMVVTDNSRNARIEVYAESNGDIDFYLTGYWSTPPGTYTETAGLTYDPSSPSGSWTDWNLSGRGIPADGILQVAMQNADTNQESRLGVREKGSSNNTRYFRLQEAESGGRDVAVWHVQLDSDTTAQWYDEVAPDAHPFAVMGWWEP